MANDIYMPLDHFTFMPIFSPSEVDIDWKKKRIKAVITLVYNTVFVVKWPCG